MTPLVKVNNEELCFKLKLNYNNVYSRIKMILGSSASLFADIATKQTHTIWYADDDKLYAKLSEASPLVQQQIMTNLQARLKKVSQELSKSSELSQYVDEILEYPGLEYIFYRLDGADCKIILTGWGCKPIHGQKEDSTASFVKQSGSHGQFVNPREINVPKNITATNGKKILPEEDSVVSFAKQSGSHGQFVNQSESNVPKDIPVTDVKEIRSKEENVTPSFEKPKCTVVILVRDQRKQLVANEILSVSTPKGVQKLQTDQKGEAKVVDMCPRDVITVSFPDSPTTQERSFEIESSREVYEVYVNKLVQYAPLLSVQNQHGEPVAEYKVKVITKGNEAFFETGSHGMVQLPMMVDGQKFVVVDTKNYAISEEYMVTPDSAMSPYCFKILVPEKKFVGITVLEKNLPVKDIVVDINRSENLYQKTTDENGHVCFPEEAFEEGKTLIVLHCNGGTVRVGLNYRKDCSDYTVRLRSHRPFDFKFKWLLILLGILLAAVAASQLIKPSIETMKKGVVLVYNRTRFFTDVKLPGGNHVRFYFVENEDGGIEGVFTDDEDEAPVIQSTGTGFIISKNGLIATNRHVANPLPPENAAQILKNYFSDVKRLCELKLDSAKLAYPQLTTRLEREYNKMSRKKYLSDIELYDKLLNIGEYSVKVTSQSSVAFYLSLIELNAEGYYILGEEFHECALVACGDPGTVEKNDVAILQLKNKERAVPKDAFVFKVPKRDLLEKKVHDNYKITAIGYNKGLVLAAGKNGIDPQAIPGQITSSSDVYRVGYNALMLGGSSGCPVLNSRYKLVAVNNSSLNGATGYNYGVRIKYLNELLDDLNSKGIK